MAKEESIMAETGNNNHIEPRGEIIIDRRSIDTITSYEVTEDQLMVIEGGSSSNELNYSIALLSFCVSLVVTILTTRIEGEAKLTFFWCAMLITGILGSYFAFEYHKKKKNASNIFIKIRAQKSTDALRDRASSASPVVKTSEEQSSNR